LKRNIFVKQILVKLQWNRIRLHIEYSSNARTQAQAKKINKNVADRFSEAYHEWTMRQIESGHLPYEIKRDALPALLQYLTISENF